VKPKQAISTADALHSQSSSELLSSLPLERRYKETAAPQNSKPPSAARPAMSARSFRFKNATRKKSQKSLFQMPQGILSHAYRTQKLGMTPSNMFIGRAEYHKKYAK